MSARFAWVDGRNRWLLVLVFVLLVTPTTGAVVLVGLDWLGVAVGGTLALVLIALALWHSSSTDDEDDTDVWNAIPSWQYSGRHVESGGLTRDEQERALRDIQEEATELEQERSR